MMLCVANGRRLDPRCQKMVKKCGAAFKILERGQWIVDREVVADTEE